MTDVEYYGDCNVAMLSLWIILIYVSVLRVAYNFLMLLLAGLFSCCCCKRIENNEDRIKETKGAGFGEDKDLGRTFIGTSYFATFAKASMKLLGDNVFESKPSEMFSKKKHDEHVAPSRSLPHHNNGTTRIDSNIIAAVPSDLGSIQLAPMESSDQTSL